MDLSCSLSFSDIPEEEARYWAKKLEQLNAMRDQDDVSVCACVCVCVCKCMHMNVWANLFSKGTSFLFQAELQKFCPSDLTRTCFQSGNNVVGLLLFSFSDFVQGTMHANLSSLSISLHIFH